MGLIALGVGFASPLALAGVAVHVVGHAVAKALGFYAALPLLGHEPRAAGHAVTGVARTQPGLGASLGVSLGALAGLPPSPLFVSEVLIVAGGFQAGRPWAAAATAILAALGFLGLGHALIETIAGKHRRGDARPATGLRPVLVLDRGLGRPPARARGRRALAARERHRRRARPGARMTGLPRRDVEAGARRGLALRGPARDRAAASSARCSPAPDGRRSARDGRARPGADDRRPRSGGGLGRARGARPVRRPLRGARAAAPARPPRPRPLELDGAGAAAATPYQVAVGPIHAGVIESGHFRFHVVGERILHVDARLFYKHRGLERAAVGQTLDGRPAVRLAGVRRLRGRERPRLCARVRGGARALADRRARPHADDPARARAHLEPPERHRRRLRRRRARGRQQPLRRPDRARAPPERARSRGTGSSSARCASGAAPDGGRERRPPPRGRARVDPGRVAERLARAALQRLVPGPPARHRHRRRRDDALALGATGPRPAPPALRRTRAPRAHGSPTAGSCPPRPDGCARGTSRRGSSSGPSSCSSRSPCSTHLLDRTDRAGGGRARGGRVRDRHRPRREPPGRHTSASSSGQATASSALRLRTGSYANWPVGRARRGRQPAPRLPADQQELRALLRLRRPMIDAAQGPPPTPPHDRAPPPRPRPQPGDPARRRRLVQRLRARADPRLSALLRPPALRARRRRLAPPRRRAARHRLRDDEDARAAAHRLPRHARASARGRARRLRPRLRSARHSAESSPARSRSCSPSTLRIPGCPPTPEAIARRSSTSSTRAHSYAGVS